MINERKNIFKLRVRKLGNFLKEAMPFLVLGMVIFFGLAILGFQRDNKVLLENTNQTLQKQDETLEAIKQVSIDNRLTSKQLGDTIICMLQVPIASRTPDLKEDCTNKALNGEVSRSMSSPIPPEAIPDSNNPGNQTSSGTSNNGGSSQPDNDGIITPEIPIIPGLSIPPIHIGSPF